MTNGAFTLPDYDSYTDSYEMNKGSTGTDSMVIPMDIYYENYLNSTLLVPISVPNWVQ